MVKPVNFFIWNNIFLKKRFRTWKIMPAAVRHFLYYLVFCLFSTISFFTIDNCSSMYLVMCHRVYVTQKFVLKNHSSNDNNQSNFISTFWNFQRALWMAIRVAPYRKQNKLTLNVLFWIVSLTKVCPIFKFRTFLESWDHSALN